MYKYLISILLEELKSECLIELSSDFYINVQAYLQSLKNKMDKGSEVEAKLAEAEAKIVIEIVQSIMAIRLRKILNGIMAGSNESLKNLLEVELNVYEKLSSAIEEFQAMTKKYTSLEEDLLAKKILVRFIRDVPAFVGVDLKTYGPFKPEDLAYIPAVNAEALVKRNVIEILGGE